MTTTASSSQTSALKKHDRSDALQHARRLQPTGEWPDWLGQKAVLNPTKAELGWLDGVTEPAVFDGLDAPWWKLTLPAIGSLFETWAERARVRRDLTQIDARSLRDAGISPGAAAFEASQHFWQGSIQLRDHPADTKPAL